MEFEEVSPWEGQVKDVGKHKLAWFERHANAKAQQFFYNKGYYWNDKRYPITIGRVFRFYMKNEFGIDINNHWL